MRIKGFSYLVDEHLQEYSLNNKTVVIDGQNYFYNLYNNSRISNIWGAECNTYAEYLCRHLKKFKEANVTCYFVFKGGCEDMEVRLRKNCGQHDHYSDIEPIFIRNIYIQVLDELGFKYVVCKKYCKLECVALAQKLSCPIISFDIEFCFLGVDYIPYMSSNRKDSIIYNNHNDTLNCKIFKPQHFLTFFHISKELLSIFIILTDELGLQTSIFENFYRKIKINFTSISRNQLLLTWLSGKTATSVTKEILGQILPKHQNDFLNAKKSVLFNLENNITPGIPTLYLTNRNKLKINEFDPFWFEKGVALNHIPIPYIDIYYYKMIVASHNSDTKHCHPNSGTESQNSLIICFDIIKYAFDLLTNFSGGSICFKYKQCCHGIGNEDIVINNNYPIRKPSYVAKNCVFENGWHNIGQYKLFHHFISEILECFDFGFLDKAPEDAQLLIIALVYFSRKKIGIVDTYDEVSSIMLSYVMLNYVLVMSKRKAPVSQKDCVIARSVLDKYFKIKDLRNRPCFCLYEFQECLEQLNYLNILCGKPFAPTIYSDTYNATFVYNVLAAKRLAPSTINEKLSAAPTVLKLYNDLMKIYEETLHVSRPVRY